MIQNNVEMMLKDVRVSFPDIYQKSVYKGKETNYGSKIILDPTEATQKGYIKKIQSIIKDLSQNILGIEEIPDADTCLRNGKTLKDETYKGKFRLSANSPNRPHVFLPGSNKDTADSLEESKIYSGCYVNAKVRIWAHEDTSRVNCQLIAIQFKRDGESFGAPVVPVEDAAEGFEVSGESTEEILSDDKDLLAAA